MGDEGRHPRVFVIVGETWLSRDERTRREDASFPYPLHPFSLSSPKRHDGPIFGSRMETHVQPGYALHTAPFEVYGRAGYTTISDIAVLLNNVKTKRDARGKYLWHFLPLHVRNGKPLASVEKPRAAGHFRPFVRARLSVDSRPFIREHAMKAQCAHSGARDGSDNKFYAHRTAPQFILPYTTNIDARNKMTSWMAFTIRGILYATHTWPHIPRHGRRYLHPAETRPQNRRENMLKDFSRECQTLLPGSRRSSSLSAPPHTPTYSHYRERVGKYTRARARAARLSHIRLEEEKCQVYSHVPSSEYHPLSLDRCLHSKGEQKEDMREGKEEEMICLDLGVPSHAAQPSSTKEATKRPEISIHSSSLTSTSPRDYFPPDVPAIRKKRRGTKRMICASSDERGSEYHQLWTPESIMSVLEAGEANRTTTMSPLDEVVSPTSVESELMVTDMLDEHEAALNEHGKRKRDTDGDGLTPRKLPSLTRNNNEVGFVLEESPDDELQEDRDDVSLPFSFSNIKAPNGILN
ncbi:hypothetical protein ALC57_15313 [Trachymyrmex cornetzi]|uniref:Uncharacterized protein n=1 Tax=Trachymyrmex cornetzi TaxID=471704 RepID=A0A195DIC0_9HYME|nr:hypothetical protein ALC57_15313 [Trachymyrmex cornetzi]